MKIQWAGRVSLIWGLWASGPSTAAELHSKEIQSFLLHFVILALLSLFGCNAPKKTSCPIIQIKEERRKTAEGGRKRELVCE